MTPELQEALEWFSGSAETAAITESMSLADLAYGKALAAEIRRRDAQTCSACRFNQNGHGFCANEHVGSDLFEVECAVVKFCGAWEAREAK